MSDEAADLENAGAELEDWRYADKKQRVIWMLLACSAMLGALVPFMSEESSRIDFVLGLPLLILGVWWCFLDADERGIRIGGLAKLLLIFVFVVGFPAYVFRTRGVRGFVTLAYALLVLAGIVVCAAATTVITFVFRELLGS